MDIKRLMKCGHVGYGETTDGKPYCLICNCDKVSEKEIPDLTGRKAKCTNCWNMKDSSFKLPFFEMRKNYNEEDGYFDSYYCGCMGWD